MKRKLPVEQDSPTIDPLLLAKAKKALDEPNCKPLSRCIICNSVAAPTSNEQLCWVCRRLKISAWRDSEVQISAQE